MVKFVTETGILGEIFSSNYVHRVSCCFYSITQSFSIGEEHSIAIQKVFIESHIRGLGGKRPNEKPSIHTQIGQTEFVRIISALYAFLLFYFALISPCFCSLWR